MDGSTRYAAPVAALVGRAASGSASPAPGSPRRPSRPVKIYVRRAPLGVLWFVLRPELCGLGSRRLILSGRGIACLASSGLCSVDATGLRCGGIYRQGCHLSLGARRRDGGPRSTKPGRNTRRRARRVQHGNRCLGPAAAQRHVGPSSLAKQQSRDCWLVSSVPTVW